jgi:hypothetical protein
MPFLNGKNQVFLSKTNHLFTQNNQKVQGMLPEMEMVMEMETITIKLREQVLAPMVLCIFANILGMNPGINLLEVKAVNLLLLFLVEIPAGETGHRPGGPFQRF